MHKHLLLIAFLFLSTYVFAQSETAENVEQTEKEDFRDFKKKINEAKDRIVINLSYDALLNLPSGMKMSGFSRGFDAYFMYDVVLGKSNFSIAPGIGVGNNNYFHKYTISTDTDGKTVFSAVDEGLKVKKSKLALTSIDIPVELRFRTTPKSNGYSWKVAIGGKFGRIVQNKWKYKGQMRDDITSPIQDTKFKIYNIDNINKWRYGVFARVGYSIINVYAYYGLSDIFNNKGPKMTPFSVGISINTF
ncbi:MAG: PorT family protein [Chitinophagales bacterium]|nr:PorT family protein [Chitinophagales bacterium]